MAHKPHKKGHLFGAASRTREGTRTPDPLIKSQLLYQLSYACTAKIQRRHGVSQILIEFFIEEDTHALRTLQRARFTGTECR